MGNLTEYQRRLTEIYLSLLLTASITARKRPGVLVGSGGAGWLAYKQGRLIVASKIAGGWQVAHEIGALSAVRLITIEVANLKAAQKYIDSIEDFNNGQTDLRGGRNTKRKNNECLSTPGGRRKGDGA